MVVREKRLLIRAKDAALFKERHLDSITNAIKETSASIEEANRSLSLLVGPRLSLASLVGKTVAVNTVSLLLAGLNPLLPLAVRSASTAHTLINISRTRRIRLGEALYSAQKTISEVLEAAQC